MRCPACGATNPDTAAWCGQCYQSFAAPTAPSAPSGATPDEREPRRAPTGHAPDGFRRRDGELEWACPACATYNPITADACVVCATPLTARFEARGADAAAPNFAAALALSAVLPGAGHIAVGRVGSGLARAVLAAVWAVGALLLLGAAGVARGLLAASPLLLGAGAVWLGSLVDLLALQRGQREVLAGRTLLWLVVGVTVLSVVTVVASTSGQASAAGTPIGLG
jgi:hypothetical protein